MKHVFIATITIGMLAFAGCEKSGDTAQTGATGSTSGKSSNANKKGANGEGLGNSQADDGQAPVDQNQTQTQTQEQTQTQQQTATTTTTTTQPSGTGVIQNKYSNVPRMSAAEKAQLVEQGYVKVDNNLKVAIISANGQNLDRIIPPGEQLMAPRVFNSGDDVATLTLGTDDGRTCSGQFDPMSVAGNFEARQQGQQGGADWRAAVIDQNGGCIIKENAGGGGGGGGGGGATIK